MTDQTNRDVDTTDAISQEHVNVELYLVLDPVECINW